jgi:hypothetical protein
VKHVRKQGLPASYQTPEDRILQELSYEQDSKWLSRLYDTVSYTFNRATC